MTRVLACPNCHAKPMRRLRTQPSESSEGFTMRLFECPSCNGKFLSGERWLGAFSKRHIPLTAASESPERCQTVPDKGRQAFGLLRLTVRTAGGS